MRVAQRIDVGLRAVIVLLLVLLAGSVAVPAALADGDPGSDVLVYQPSFVPADAAVSVADQVRLSGMLRAAEHSAGPIRVAIIAHRDDLGAVTALWRKPQVYAHFLGVELSLGYKGQLVVVMPNGFGLNWPGHSTTAALKALSEIPIRPTGPGMVAAAVRAAGTLGVRLTPAAGQSATGSALQRKSAVIPTITAGPAPAKSAPEPGNHASVEIAIGIGVVLVLAALGAVLRRGGRWRQAARALAAVRPRGRPIEAPSDEAERAQRIRWIPIAIATIAVVVLVVLVIVIHAGSPTPTASALATNPSLDPGAPLSGQVAPDFTLYDQFGRRVSLHQFRGKVTLLDFNDSECTTVCPLTTTAMLDARRMLGSAARHVQLLGVDANPKATAIDDVLSYTQLHGLAGRWRFLTGSLPQLRRVWRAYHIQADIQRGLISHTPALYVLDTHGRLRRLYITQQNYAAVGQLGQELAHEISDLLPSHPAVQSHLSYRPVAGIGPKHTVQLVRARGGTVTLGPGKPHLYLFFDTWNRETTSIAAELDGLNAYAATAAKRGLPPLTAIDEGSVEPSPSALPRFLDTLKQPLRYPVALDANGRVADGYQVQGEPWLVLTSATGKILWFDAIETSPWPGLGRLRSQVHAALSPAGQRRPQLQQQLIGSPAPLAKLHRQASRVIGSEPQLLARIRALQGYPVVVNVWASWCEPCQRESGLFAHASLQFGRQVAFIGADADASRSSGQAFLSQQHASYPNYSVTQAGLRRLLTGGLEGLPTTIYINRDGKVASVHDGQYSSQGVLNSDIDRIALDSR